MIDKKRISKTLDDAFLKLYKLILDEDSKVEDFIEAFWNLIEEIYSYILSYIRNKIPEAANIHVNIKDLLYDDLDEQRIKNYYDFFRKGSIKSIAARNKFMYELSRIFITEVGHVKDGLFKEIGKKLLGKYEVWLCIEQSVCGEVGGEELLDEVWMPIKEAPTGIIDSWDEYCDNHPNCPGHVVDIEVREKDV